MREAEAGLSILGIVCPVRIVSRNVYQDAHGVGLGVQEFDPDGKAAEEIKALWLWIKRKMEKLNREQETHVA